MKSKKVFSIILSLSLTFSAMLFCSAQNCQRTFTEDDFNNIKKWAEGYNRNCTLSSNNEFTKCAFNDDKEKIQLIKYADGDFKVSNSTDAFISYKGDNIWIYNNQPKFYQIKNGLVNLNKLTDLLFRWGGLNSNLKAKFGIKNKNDIMKSPFNVSSFWNWWYVPIVGGLAWLGNLIYKNYKFTHKNINPQDNNSQVKFIYYPLNDVNPILIPQENQEKPSNLDTESKKTESAEKKEKDSEANKDFSKLKEGTVQNNEVK